MKYLYPVKAKIEEWKYKNRIYFLSSGKICTRHNRIKKKQKECLKITCHCRVVYRILQKMKNGLPNTCGWKKLRTKQIVVNIVMKVWVPQKTKNILAKWGLLASLHKGSFVCWLVGSVIGQIDISFIRSFTFFPASPSVSQLARCLVYYINILVFYFQATFICIFCRISCGTCV